MVKDNNKDSLNPKLILILIALLILLMLAGGYLAYSLLSGKEDKTATTPEKNKITQTTPEKGKKDKSKNTKKIKSKNKKVDKSKDKDKQKVSSEDKQKISSEEGKKENAKDKQKDTSKEEVTNKPQNEEENVSNNEEETEIMTEEDMTEENNEPSEQKPIKLADLTTKAATKKETKDLNNKLNQMPFRSLKIKSPFAFKKEVIQVEESNFKDLQKESVAIAGKFSPFEVGDLLPTLDDKNSLQNKTSSLPEIPEIPDTISLPPGLEGNILSTDTSNFDQQNNESMISSSSPPSSDELDSASLTGVIGDSAIINFNGQSRALHVGQNYKGIVVLSISDKSVLLELNGIKVIKELRDRF